MYKVPEDFCVRERSVARAKAQLVARRGEGGDLSRERVADTLQRLDVRVAGRVSCGREKFATRCRAKVSRNHAVSRSTSPPSPSCCGVDGGGGGMAETGAAAGVRKDGGASGASAANGGTDGGRGAEDGEAARGGAGSGTDAVGGVAGAGEGEDGGGMAREDDEAAGCDEGEGPAGTARHPGTATVAAFAGATTLADLAEAGREPSLAVESPRDPSPALYAARRSARYSSHAAFTHAGMSDARPRDRMTLAAITPSRRTAEHEPRTGYASEEEEQEGVHIPRTRPLSSYHSANDFLPPLGAQQPWRLSRHLSHFAKPSRSTQRPPPGCAAQYAHCEGGQQRRKMSNEGTAYADARRRLRRGGAPHRGWERELRSPGLLLWRRSSGGFVRGKGALGLRDHHLRSRFVLRHANGAGGNFALRARSRRGLGLLDDLDIVAGQLIHFRLRAAHLGLNFGHGSGGLVLALAIGALSRELSLHLGERLAVEGVCPWDALINGLPFHPRREPRRLTHQAHSLVRDLFGILASPDDGLRSCASTRRANSTYSSSPAILPPGADANSALSSSRAAARSCAGVAVFLPFAAVDLAAVDADMTREEWEVGERGNGGVGESECDWKSRGESRARGSRACSGGVPLFADSGTIAANDVACQRSVVSALRTRAAITKRANAAATRDRAARPGERAQKSHGKRGKFAFDFAFERSHRAAKIFGASERGDVAGPGAAEDAYRRVGAIVEQAKTFTRCEIHGFADFALRTEEAVPLDDQEGLIKGLTAKDHLDARRDRQKLTVASIIRQDQLRRTRAKAANTYHAIVQLILCLKPLLARARIRIHQAFQDGQLLKHLRARECRDFIANFDGATVKILQSRLHGEPGDAKNVSTLSQPRGRALIPPRYRARSHRWLNGDVQDLSEGEMMRPTNRYQQFSHSARTRPRPLRHSLARAKRLDGVREPIDPREAS
ncbi:LOW QUALITY PROTEIN: hypothetical protein ACG7TL_003067 [Trametes sanguinea]